MRNWILAILASALLSTMLAGCAENQGDLGNKNIRSNSIRYDANGNLIIEKKLTKEQMNEKFRMNSQRLNDNNYYGSHKNEHIEMSEELTKHVAQMAAIKTAYVLLTEHNAYVAVSLDAAEPTGDSKMMGRTNSSTLGKDGIHMSKRMSSLSTGHHMLTEQMKAEIADRVRQKNRSVEHVYISANPDFVGRMNAYSHDAKQGYPIQGFVAEFNAMAERIFPLKSSDVKAKGYSVKSKGMD